MILVEVTVSKKNRNHFVSLKAELNYDEDSRIIAKKLYAQCTHILNEENGK